MLRVLKQSFSKLTLIIGGQIICHKTTIYIYQSLLCDGSKYLLSEVDGAGLADNGYFDLSRIGHLVLDFLGEIEGQHFCIFI